MRLAFLVRLNDRLRQLDAPEEIAFEAARLLGEFTVPQGTTRGAFAIRGEALLECLNADTNGLLTLMITRVTDETATSGLAHAFASKENTRNTPPLLKVRLE